MGWKIFLRDYIKFFIINFLILLTLVVLIFVYFDRGISVVGWLIVLFVILWSTLISFLNGYYFKLKAITYCLPYVILTLVSFLVIVYLSIALGGRLSLSSLLSIIIFLVVFVGIPSIIAVLFALAGRNYKEKNAFI